MTEPSVMGEPSATGRFGEFGGRFVPETLVPRVPTSKLPSAKRGATPRFGPSSTRCCAITRAGRHR